MSQKREDSDVTRNQSANNPRLELLAVTIGVRVLEFITQEIDAEKTYLWTDSACVLQWLRKSPVKVTHPTDFRVNPTSGIVGAKQTLMLKIKRLKTEPRSDRFDLEALPYIEELLQTDKRTTRVPLKHRIRLFFSFGYVPIVYSVRYKQVEPWDAIFPALDDPDNLKISPHLSQICKEAGITQEEREHLTLNEFIILDAATTRTETDSIP
uniref:Integrase catalytic domain-containing protein n=1 Tax=Loa loa TaxID=7209 RepID=A0A1I7W2V3_LOALO